MCCMFSGFAIVKVKPRIAGPAELQLSTPPRCYGTTANGKYQEPKSYQDGKNFVPVSNCNGQFRFSKSWD